MNYNQLIEFKFELKSQATISINGIQKKITKLFSNYFKYPYFWSNIQIENPKHP